MSIIKFIEKFTAIRKERREKSSNNSVKDLTSRPLDGTYKILTIHDPRRNAWGMTREDAKATERSALRLNGNHFDIFINYKDETDDITMLKEKGTFSLKMDKGQEKITFFVDGDVIFATGFVERGRDYDAIKKLTIHDKNFEFPHYQLYFVHEY